MLFDAALLLLGFALLFLGGEALVRGAVSLANRLGLSPLVIGLTVVGFGTSTPELLVSLQAALRGAPDIAVGNVVGSNIANVLLILGVSAVIFPIATRIDGLARDLVVLLAASALMLVLGAFGGIGRGVGIAMVVALACYVGFATLSGRTVCDEEGELSLRLAAWTEVVLLLAGFAALLAGSNMLVGSAIRIARGFGISEAVIGLSVVAIGTSLPELATSIVAALRRHSDVAIGNVIGSNIFNLLGILGVTAAVEPVSIAPSIAVVDIPLMGAVTVCLVAVLTLAGRMSRPVGAAFLLLYAAYIGYLF